MSAPYRRYAPIERLEDRSAPFDSGFDCTGDCPGSDCCGECVTEDGCSCKKPVDDAEDIIVQEAIDEHREEKSS